MEQEVMQQEEKSPLEEARERAKAQKERNIQNNAKSIQAAATIAENSGHPVAMAIGKGVNIADKITGGKLSQKLGKHLNTLNKLNGFKGKMMQNALNKMAESGAADTVAMAASVKNGSMSVPKGGATPGAGTDSKPGLGSSLGKSSPSSGSTDSGEGGVNFSVSSKTIKTIAIAAIPTFAIIIFCCLLISASQVYLNSMLLGTADNISLEETGEEINKKGEITDEDIEEIDDEDIAYDTYIVDSKSLDLRNKKLGIKNAMQVVKEKKRKYNEATLDMLEDLFPSVIDKNTDYDENKLVYDFLFKMYNLSETYKDKYDVILDLPLLMATLNIQSTDKNVVFNSNLSDVDKEDKPRKMPIEEFDYNYDWSNYKIRKNNSEHDMEILAQHMVSKQAKEICKDSSGNKVKENILKDAETDTQVLTCEEGQTYEKEELGYVIDNKKYKEFLKEFLEKKYYLTEEEQQAVHNENNPNYAEGVTFINGGFTTNIYYYNQKNYQNYYYSKDPYNLAVNKTDYCALGIGDCYQSIASSGCGPTSMSIAVSTLLNEPHDPIELTAKVCSHNGCFQSGTSGAAFEPTAKEYGLKVESTYDTQKITNALASGNSIVIVLAGPGDFTRGGHYINLTAVNDKGEVFVADCFTEGHNHWWSFSRIIEQSRGFWIVSR